jgi:hypothetical protein
MTLTELVDELRGHRGPLSLEQWGEHWYACITCLIWGDPVEYQLAWRRGRGWPHPMPLRDLHLGCDYRNALQETADPQMWEDAQVWLALEAV